MNAFDSTLLDGKTKLHFVGIGGSGMFPLVQILHEVGYEITGSDVNEGDIIERERKMGIPISMGHKAENVHGAERVVYSAAIMKGNPEVEEAQRLGIPAVERSIMLGYVDVYKRQAEALCCAPPGRKTPAEKSLRTAPASQSFAPAPVFSDKHQSNIRTEQTYKS